MSTGKRSYELKARAEGQERTRRRIAKAAAELHERVGPAATTVAEIARRAGVSRLTYYKHFPDNEALYPACSAHYLERHPMPDFETPLGREDPAERARALLATLYREIFRDRQAMLRNLLRDRGADPVLDVFMRENLDAVLDGLGSALVAGFEVGDRSRERLRAIVAVAMEFRTWETLTGLGLDDEEAAGLMAGSIAAVAAVDAGRPSPVSTRAAAAGRRRAAS